MVFGAKTNKTKMCEERNPVRESNLRHNPIKSAYDH